MKKITLDLSESQVKKIDWLKEYYGTAFTSEVLRRAINHYYHFTEKHKKEIERLS